MLVDERNGSDKPHTGLCTAGPCTAVSCAGARRTHTAAQPNRERRKAASETAYTGTQEEQLGVTTVLVSEPAVLTNLISYGVMSEARWRRKPCVA